MTTLHGRAVEVRRERGEVRCCSLAAHPSRMSRGIPTVGDGPVSVRVHGERGSADERATHDRGDRSVDVERDPPSVLSTGSARGSSGGCADGSPSRARRRSAPRSRAPRWVANKTPVEVEEAIVRVRKELHRRWGGRRGGDDLAFDLRDLPGLPHEATIWRILTARGLVTADPSKAPKRARRSFTAERANDCWQLDDTGWELADGTEVKILNVLDDHSRLAVASTAMITCTGAAALAVLAAAAAMLGWPARFLSDNATVFRHTLATAEPRRSGWPPATPAPTTPRPAARSNGSTRPSNDGSPSSHRRPPSNQLQAQLDLFRLIYNHHRPQRGCRPPTPRRRMGPRPQERPRRPALSHPHQDPPQHHPQRDRLRRPRQHRRRRPPRRPTRPLQSSPAPPATSSSTDTSSATSPSTPPDDANPYTPGPDALQLP